MAEPIRVLQVFHGMDCGGAENMIMNLYRHMDRTMVQFDFLVHTNNKCFFDDEIEALGGRIFHAPYYKVINTLSDSLNKLNDGSEQISTGMNALSTGLVILILKDLQIDKSKICFVRGWNTSYPIIGINNSLIS